MYEVDDYDVYVIPLEEGEYAALVTEFPDLSWVSVSESSAIAGVTALLEDLLNELEDTGEEIPVPITLQEP